MASTDVIAGAGGDKAIAHFESALELDPRYARAHAAMAETHVLLPFYGIAPPREAMPRARRAAERALEMAPELAAAHMVLGHVLHEYEWDPEGAEAEFLLVRERIEESRPHIEKALELDPLSPIASLMPAALSLAGAPRGSDRLGGGTSSEREWLAPSPGAARGMKEQAGTVRLDLSNPVFQRDLLELGKQEQRQVLVTPLLTRASGRPHRPVARRGGATGGGGGALGADG